ncbi:putative iron-regulated membrane protein [Roseimicrobium gellanilyticum]|uniref:Putative iron-regulated membrane protein n=1 Tax=Roseimicrobium gellanilyticum TaxID=748857 RepID=A0A366HUK7_9BACT|nr:PepSY-associated TM helix domain-containing protein [Roseimicrobium gellanilyticum]RBP47359.1 putative iron-regulated membrane protein [Roseimicrobium gellanilyticum]
MKRRLFFLHSWLGLVAGFGLIIIGLTGSVLVFKDELDGVLFPQMLKVDPAGRERQSFDALLSSARKAVPGYEVMGWDKASAPDRADLAYVVKHGTDTWQGITVNPYTGEVLAKPMDREDTITGWLLSFHYSFLADHTGELIAGLCAALLCLLGITGVWLYRGFWKTLFTLRWGRSARIFFSDFHKMVGITSVAFNLILGFTGAWWNLGHLIGHLLEEEHAGEEEAQKITQTYYSSTITMDALVKKAQEKIPGFSTGFISLPSAPGLGITLYGQAGEGLLTSPYGSTVMFDQQTGEVKEVKDLRQAGAWAKIEDTFRPLHFGNFGGIPVKILWCIGGLTPGTLAVTGFFMWWKRRNPPRKKKASGNAPEKSATLEEEVAELAARRVQGM